QILRYVAVERGTIHFRHLVLGRGQAMDQRRLIREQQQTAGVFVEPSDARYYGIAAAPARGEERIYIGSFPLVMRAHHADGLVQHYEQTVRMVERFAPHPN